MIYSSFVHFQHVKCGLARAYMVGDGEYARELYLMQRSLKLGIFALIAGLALADSHKPPAQGPPLPPGTPTGQSQTPPQPSGQAGQGSGQSQAPGQTGQAPAQSQAPGQAGQGSGQSQASGQTGQGPGQSQAPGQ